MTQCDYPIFSTTIGRWQSNEKLKNKARTPLGVSGIILELIKDHFRNNSERFKFIDDNELESKIVIDLHQQWKPENPSNYPGIYLKRESWQYRAEGNVIGDFKASMIPDDPMSTEFWVPVTTNYSLNLIGKDYGALEVLADELSSYLLFFGFYIEQYLNFHRFQINNISGISLMQEPRGFRICNINLVITFDAIWRVKLEKPIIQRTNINVKGQC